MKRKKITRHDIASLLDLSYRTIHSRFNGESEWGYSECVKVRDTYFPDMELSYLFSTDNTSSDQNSMENKNTDRSTIPTSILPNLFTLCTLQAFATHDGAKCFYEILCHFRSFGSATCLIADKR